MKEHSIHVDWDGPYSMARIRKFADDSLDFGLYQVYGKHPVYGDEVLLYIGLAADCSFARAIRNDGWSHDRGLGEPQAIYIGRIRGADELESDKRMREISLAERLLVFSHDPAYNSIAIKALPDKRVRYIHVYNWGQFGDLLPEASGARWTSLYDVMPGYHYICYDSH